MKNKYLTFGATACLVIGILGIADASNRLPRLPNCSDKDVYAEHTRWCDYIEAGRMLRRQHARAQAPTPQVTYYGQITTTHDHQGVNDASSTNTPYIALQTAADVAQSGGYASARTVWSPGVLTMGSQRLWAMVTHAATKPRLPEGDFHLVAGARTGVDRNAAAPPRTNVTKTVAAPARIIINVVAAQ
jgi:hypothetical protein